LLTTGIYGVVKTVTTIFYVGYLVDRVGRRIPLLIGATLQATAMLYLALYLRFAGTNTETVGGTPAGGIVGIIWIYIYAFGWSFGHSVACYVVAAEVFPTRIVSEPIPEREIFANTVSVLSVWRFASSSTG
jgi:MFS family permease